MSLIDWYDKEGNPLTMEEASVLFADMDYKRVASTEIGPYWVSTVWLGLDHRFSSEGPPIIFETMVFSRDQRDDPEGDGLTDIDCRRYCTEQEALEGHEELCTLIRATLVTEVDMGATEPPEGPETPPGGSGGGQMGLRCLV